MAVVTTSRAPVNSIGGYFDNEVVAKRRLLPIIDESGTLLFCACGDYMSSHSQLSYHLKKKKTL